MSAGDLYYYFLAMHPEYNYYALLDINQDGDDEILVCESNVIGEQLVDIWVIRGGIYYLECEDIWPRVAPLTYNDFYCWVENRLDVPGGWAATYYWVEENGKIRGRSREPYDTFGDEIIFLPRPE